VGRTGVTVDWLEVLLWWGLPLTCLIVLIRAAWSLAERDVQGRAPGMALGSLVLLLLLGARAAHGPGYSPFVAVQVLWLPASVLLALAGILLAAQRRTWRGVLVAAALGLGAPLLLFGALNVGAYAPGR
jgi:hypothetical protein